MVVIIVLTNPHSYSVGTGVNFGYGYGDYLIQFNVPPPPSLLPDDPWFKNVWTVGDSIYHTTPSGVDVYNADASSRVGVIVLPSWLSV